MLYLIKDRDYVKIGFTKDIEDRMKSAKRLQNIKIILKALSTLVK